MLFTNPYHMTEPANPALAEDEINGSKDNLIFFCW